MKNKTIVLEGISYNYDTKSFDINFKHDDNDDIVKLTYASKLVVKESSFTKIKIYYASILDNKNID